MKPLIIYADDDIASLRLMEELGKDYGFDVKCTATGEGLVEIITGNCDKYCLALVDMNLGIGMTGYVTREKIKEVCPEMPVIILTNYRLASLQGDPDVWNKSDYTIQELADRILSFCKVDTQPAEVIE